jgi:Restriction endonuclease
MNMRDAQIINELAMCLYGFLPGSGNNNTAFPLAANKVGIGDFWVAGSKHPAIVGLLTNTLEKQRHKITELLLEVVRQSITWRRNKANPLTKEEIVILNGLLAKLGFKIPELNDKDFLDSLPSTDQSQPSPQVTATPISEAARLKLRDELLLMSSLEAHARGRAFEGFLCDLFQAFNLIPKKAFSLVGEQIDGSFQLKSEIYLLEAKWEAQEIGQAELLTFAGKVKSKAEWTRGVFISNSGFTEAGLQAFGSGRRTNIICVDGLDLYHVIEGKLGLIEVLEAKTRRAAETNRAYVSVRELFPSVI